MTACLAESDKKTESSDLLEANSGESQQRIYKNITDTRIMFT